MEFDDEDGEDEDEELLDADAAHVDVDAPQDLVVAEIGLRGGGGAEELDEEGEDVEQDKVDAETPGLDLGQAGVRGEVEDHAAEDHVDVGVDPERSDEEEDEVDHVGSVGGGVFDRDHAEEVSTGLPEGGHGDDPAIAFSMDYALGDVSDERDGEEDREDVGGGDVRAKLPDRVVVIVGDIAMRVGGIVDCHLEDVLSCWCTTGQRMETQLTMDRKAVGKVAKKR